MFLKFSIAVVLVLSVMAFQLAGSLYMAYFKANQEYITVKYCVNKDAPEKKCNGKCHMRKQLKQLKEYKTAEFPVEIPDFNPVNYTWESQLNEVIFQLPSVIVFNAALFGANLSTPSAGFYLISEPPPEC